MHAIREHRRYALLHIKKESGTSLFECNLSHRHCNCRKEKVCVGAPGASRDIIPTRIEFVRSESVRNAWLHSMLREFNVKVVFVGSISALGIMIDETGTFVLIVLQSYIT